MCLQSHLQLFNPAQTVQLPLPLQDGLRQPTSDSKSMFGRNIDEVNGLEDLVTENYGMSVDGLLLNDLADPPKDLPHIIDGASAALGMKVLGSIPKAPEAWDNQI